MSIRCLLLRSVFRRSLLLLVLALLGNRVFTRAVVAAEKAAVAVTRGAESRDGEPDEPIVPKTVIPLFNGRDLNGWTTWLVDSKQQDPRGVYTVRDGMLWISGDGFGYLSTTRAYKDYRLVAEVKWGTRNYRTRVGMARDSGIFLHSVGPEGNSYDCGWGSRERNAGPDVSNGAYKAAIECQVMEGGFGDILLIHGRYADGRNVPVHAAAHVIERHVDADYAKYQFAPDANESALSAAAIAWLGKELGRISVEVQNADPEARVKPSS